MDPVPVQSMPAMALEKGHILLTGHWWMPLTDFILSITQMVDFGACQSLHSS